MANMFKQRLIKPGRDFNYSEGQKVLANAAIKADQIVYIMGSSGPFSKVDVADADGVTKSRGRLLIAKHDIPANGYGVCVPWKLVTTVDTSAAGVAVGDPVFLASTPGTTVASNITLDAPTGVGTQSIIIGRVTIADTIANGAAIMIQAATPEERVQSGNLIQGSAAGAFPGDMYTYAVQMDTVGSQEVDLTDLPFDVVMIDAYFVAASDGGDSVLTVENNAGTVCITCAAPAAATGAVGRAATIVKAQASVAQGEKMSLNKTNGHANDMAFVTVIRT